MTESQFDPKVRLWLQERYFRHGDGDWCGVWENNKTGYKDQHHRPFGGKGGPDLCGYLGPLHVEIEIKAIRGRQKPEQKSRDARVNKHGAIYVLCRETGDLESHPKHAEPVDTGFLMCCSAIDAHARSVLNLFALRKLGLA